MADDELRPAKGARSRAHWDRREFIQNSAWLGLGGLTLLPGCTDEAPVAVSPPAFSGEAQVRSRRTLGRSGIEIPDISFGGWGLDGEEDLVRHALDRGITHFDTAPDYADGRSEQTIGSALAGDRQRVTLATKFMARANATRGEIMSALEKSLRQFGTDYVDVYFNHAVNRVERIRNPEWIAFVDAAKQQGKIRASGMSGHSGRLAECVDAAIDDDITDVFLLAHNYANEPDFWSLAQRFKDVFTGGFDFVAYQSELPRLLQRAQDANLGVMVMKTRRGARYNDLGNYQTPGASEAQAAFRWVLSNPNVDGLIVTMEDPAAVDDYLGASGSGPPTLADTELLLRYEAANAGSLCQQGCSACATACPLGVDISGTLRTRMYSEDYGHPEIAKREYAALEANASPCLDCASPVCASACPSHIHIQHFAADTHRALS